MRVNQEERNLEWVKDVVRRIRDDPDISARIERSGYIAFIRHADGYRFEVVDRHYDDDMWRSREMGQASAVGSVARFSHQVTVVDTPELESVEVPNP